MRVGLVIEYEGTDFHGSQLQANARTVQGELESALSSLFDDAIRAHLASRTDAGVHALGQVAAFDVETRLHPDSIRKALNYYLPDDIRVRCAQPVPGVEAGRPFDPRRHAHFREYVYTLNDAGSAPAINRRTEVHVRGKLDAAAMNHAAGLLVGRHDFAAFAGPATKGDASTVRRVDFANVTRDGDRVIFSISANAFLHQQVRRTAAALIEVGRGAMTPERFGGYVDSGVRGEAADVLAPHGLCLTKIEYQGEGPCGLPVGNGADKVN